MGIPSCSGEASHVPLTASPTMVRGENRLGKGLACIFAANILILWPIPVPVHFDENEEQWESRGYFSPLLGGLPEGKPVHQAALITHLSLNCSNWILVKQDQRQILRDAGHATG